MLQPGRFSKESAIMKRTRAYRNGTHKKGGPKMIYYHLMETLRKNEYFITRDLVNELRGMPEIPHYSSLKEDVLYERVHQVIYHTYKRHCDALSRESSKNTIRSFYSDLGRSRSAEGIPLNETIGALFLIKKRICRCVIERMALDEGYAPGQVAGLFFNVGLFFDRMAEGIITGYEEAGSQVAEA